MIQIISQSIDRHQGSVGASVRLSPRSRRDHGSAPMAANPSTIVTAHISPVNTRGSICHPWSIPPYPCCMNCSESPAGLGGVLS